MSVGIEVDAYKAILYGTLSCKCPVTEETERALFEEYFRCKSENIVDFAPIKAIADRNPARTPVHNLFEIASYGHDDPTNFTITQGDALRALGSKFHFNNLVSSLDHLIVRDVPSFLVSHMLVPARLARFEDRIQAFHAFDGREILFAHVFFPPDIKWDENRLYAVHMGTVICSLTPDQADGLSAHLNVINDLTPLRSQVFRVDFRDFQYYGDYYRQVETRFRRYFEI
jgi:hypothetical protein